MTKVEELIASLRKIYKTPNEKESQRRVFSAKYCRKHDVIYPRGSQCPYCK
jgi:hypothetical protein